MDGTESSFSCASLGRFGQIIGSATNGGAESTALSASSRILRPTTKNKTQDECLKSSRLTLKEFSAWVQVDGRPLDCFLPYANKKHKEANCWIASVAGEEFTVEFQRNEATKCHCDVTLYLDGFLASGDVLYKDEPEEGCKRTFKYAWSSPTTKHVFKFAPIELVDGEAQLENVRPNEDSAFKPGEIRLVVTRVTHLKEEKPRKAKGKIRKLLDDRVPEDSEKWELPKPQKLYEGNGGKVVHQVVFADQIEEESPNYSFNSHEEIATFIFQYRTRETLERSQIIRTPTTTARIPGAASTSSAQPSQQSSTVETQGKVALASSTPNMTQQERSATDDTPPSQSHPPAQEDSDDDFYVRTPEPEVPLSAPPEALVHAESSEEDVAAVMLAVVSTLGKRKSSALGHYPEYDSVVSEGIKRIKLEPGPDEEASQQQQLHSRGVKKEEDDDILYDVDDAKRVEILQGELEEIKNRYLLRRAKREQSPINVLVPGEVIDLT